jgi:methionine-rich copper-binding protein CopC
MKKFLTLTAIAFTATLSAVAPAMADLKTEKPAATGTTAAAVSIKFNENCNCSGSFYQTTNTNGGSNGLKELSSAVATGPSGAKANSSTDLTGTKASALASDSTLVSTHTEVSYKSVSPDGGVDAKTVSDVDYTGSAQGMTYIPVGISATTPGITGSAIVPANVIPTSGI